jgi:hypothetical protein
MKRTKTDLRKNFTQQGKAFYVTIFDANGASAVWGREFISETTTESLLTSDLSTLSRLGSLSVSLGIVSPKF